MKRVMILGANNFMLPLILKAKEEGYYTIVVSPDENEPGFVYADEGIILDIRDKEAILEKARTLKIDGIITDQAETPVRTVAYVAEQLGLPGIGTDTAELFTNKYLMREKCREIGLDIIKYQVVTECEEAVTFYRKLHNEGATFAIMKPIDSAGSRGVVKIESEDTIRELFEYTKAASKTGTVIIEEYIDGKELLLDGVTVNNTYQTLVCGEYKKCNVPGVFSEYMGKYPAEITEEQRVKVESFVKHIIEGFGLQWGRTHTEVKVNDDGVWLMETAARGGGRYISSETVSMMTNFNSASFLLQACTENIQVVPNIEKKNISCGYVSFFMPVGEVISVEGIKEVIDLPYTYSHNFEDIYVGRKTIAFQDKIEGKFIHLKANDDIEFYERVEEIKALIKLKVQTEKGIEGPIWEF
mgnify:CR=1 FL=1